MKMFSLLLTHIASSDMNQLVNPPEHGLSCHVVKGPTLGESVIVPSKIIMPSNRI